jgi:hypothetical protein
MPLFKMMKSEPTMDSHALHVSSCIADLNAFAALMRAESAIKGDALWTDIVYIELRTNAIVHRLLDCPAHTRTMPHDAIFEALRLGAILWVIRIKRRCGSFLWSPTDYVLTLFGLLSVQPVKRDAASASNRLAIRSWLLVICGISACDPTQRQSCVKLMVLEMTELGWGWDQLIMSAHQLPWTSDFDASCAELRQQM